MDWNAISNSLSYWFIGTIAFVLVIIAFVLLRRPIIWYLGLATLQRELRETREALARLEAEVKTLRREG